MFGCHYLFSVVCSMTFLPILDENDENKKSFNKLLNMEQ